MADEPDHAILLIDDRYRWAKVGFVGIGIHAKLKAIETLVGPDDTGAGAHQLVRPSVQRVTAGRETAGDDVPVAQGAEEAAVR